jgi:eukaryotic-like serine/threonine-protein kinase
VRAPLPWRAAAAIGVEVAEALTAAHASGVVHRDVKPGNVMLTPTGVKILDFGISAVAGEPDDDETGATFGTPAYVAPERLDGKPAEPATDVYGLGVLLFEMVTGEPPYPVDTWEELARARAGGSAVLPVSLPPAFRDLVGRCLVDEPDRRPSAAEVGEVLARLVPAAPVPAGGRPRKGRRQLVFWSGIVALAVSVLAVFVSLGSSRQSEDAGRSPATAPPQFSPSPTPTTAPPSALATSKPATAKPRTAAPPLTVDVAISRARSAIEAGREDGQIRPDVAVDLLNLLRTVDGGQADDRVAELQRKVDERVQEGNMDPDRARLIRSRLSDLDRALASG